MITTYSGEQGRAGQSNPHPIARGIARGYVRSQHWLLGMVAITWAWNVAGDHWTPLRFGQGPAPYDTITLAAVLAFFLWFGSLELVRLRHVRRHRHDDSAGVPRASARSRAKHG